MYALGEGVKKDLLASGEDVPGAQRRAGPRGCRRAPERAPQERGLQEAGCAPPDLQAVLQQALRRRRVSAAALEQPPTDPPR